jgi:hypothetical protein
VDASLARNAVQDADHWLYDDLLNTAAAATLLEFQDPSSVRKLIIAGRIPSTMFVRFGKRGVFRIRSAALLKLRRKSLIGRVV